MLPTTIDGVEQKVDVMLSAQTANRIWEAFHEQRHYCSADECSAIGINSLSISLSVSKIPLYPLIFLVSFHILPCIYLWFFLFPTSSFLISSWRSNKNFFSFIFIVTFYHCWLLFLFVFFIPLLVLLCSPKNILSSFTCSKPVLTFFFLWKTIRCIDKSSHSS